MKKKEINEVKDTRNDDRMLGARYGWYQEKNICSLTEIQKTEICMEKIFR